jgi:hypothetical protein
MSLLVNSENPVLPIAHTPFAQSPQIQQPLSLVDSNNHMFPAGSDPIARKLHDLFGHQITAQRTTAISRVLTQVFIELPNANHPLEMLAAQIGALNNQLPFKHAATQVANILAWHLAKEETLRNSSTHILQRGLKLLFRQSPLESRWHTDLLPAHQSESSKDILIKAIIALGTEQSATVTKIHKALFSIPMTMCALTESEMISLSIFAATIKAPSGYLKKNLFDIPRSIHCNSENHDLYLLSKNKEKTKDGIVIGSSKKVTFGYKLPSLDTDMEPIAELTNIYESQSSVIVLEEETNLQRAFHKKVNGQGIWPILSVCTYSKSPSAQKISIIMPAADGTLIHLLKNHKSIPILSICRQLCFGLCAVHQSGYLHGDLNPNNVLYIMTEKSGCKIGYSDFGFCFKVDDMQPPQIFKKGFYGSVATSPPEFFGQNDFAGNFFAVEMWAFGCILHNLVFGIDPPWINEVTDKYHDLCVEALRNPEDVDVKVSLQDQTRFKELVFEHIEEPRKKFLQDKRIDPIKKALTLLVYDCLRFDPYERLDCTAALKKILELSK